MKKQFGFTLIELLVIISIVGLVSSVALANLNEARKRAQISAGIQQEISIRNAAGDSMVGEWSFNGSPGVATVATDTSGNGNDGTIVNGSFVEPGSNGSGSAVYLGGPGAYVTGTGIASGNNENTTVTAWVNPNEITDARSIFNSGYDGFLNYSLAISSGGIITRTQNFLAPVPEDCDVCEGSSLIKNNVWTFVATTFSDSGEINIYTNGTLAQTYSGIPTVGASGSNTRWTIGALSSNGGGTSATENFSGLIDEVRVYRGTNPFAASDIHRLYTQELEARKFANI